MQVKSEPGIRIQHCVKCWIQSKTVQISKARIKQAYPIYLWGLVLDCSRWKLLACFSSDLVSHSLDPLPGTGSGFGNAATAHRIVYLFPKVLSPQGDCWGFGEVFSASAKHILLIFSYGRTTDQKAGRMNFAGGLKTPDRWWKDFGCDGNWGQLLFRVRGTAWAKPSVLHQGDWQRLFTVWAMQNKWERSGVCQLMFAPTPIIGVRKGSCLSDIPTSSALSPSHKIAVKSCIFMTVQDLPPLRHTVKHALFPTE